MTFYIVPIQLQSSQAWSILFKELFARGLKPPLLIIMGDGALGLWNAVDDIPEFATIRSQRCWVHEIANGLDKLPKRLQLKAKLLLHDIMNAEKRVDAEGVKRRFDDGFGDKYPKAVKSLNEGWEELTSFFDFPAQHLRHIRTTNPIESAFATWMPAFAGMTSNDPSPAFFFCRPREGGDPAPEPPTTWMPAFAGMTNPENARKGCYSKNASNSTRSKTK